MSCVPDPRPVKCFREQNLYFFDENRIKDSLVSAKFPVENIKYANTPERALI